MIRKGTDTLARALFFRRVLRLVFRDSASPVLRAAARNGARARDLWRPMWPVLKQVPECDAVLLLLFTLACDAEGLDPREATARMAASADPLSGMRRFLVEQGRMRLGESTLPVRRLR